jgi:hypothetical protein
MFEIFKFKCDKPLIYINLISTLGNLTVIKINCIYFL